MNPLLLKALPYLLFVALSLALLGMTHLYMGERDALAVVQSKFDTFTASVKSEGQAAEALKAKTEDSQNKALVQIKEDHEALLPQIRDDAVANYLAAHPARIVRVPSRANPGGGTVLGDGPSIQVDDATVCQPVPDEPFIKAAAEDVAKLGAWIDYCTLNHCPVKD